MMAVIFEVQPAPGQQDAYLQAAAALRPLLEQVDGFISIERFQSLTEPGRLLSLSFWRDEEAVACWRQMEAHRHTQRLGRASIFRDYRLRVPLWCGTTACRTGKKRRRIRAPRWKLACRRSLHSAEST